MTDEKIQTLHPDPDKSGVNISRAKYDTVRAAILDALSEVGEETFKGLSSLVKERLEGKFDGSIGWYYTSVKLDLEARGEVERVPRSRPQRIRLPATARD